MAPYEALYGKKCRTLICWSNESQLQPQPHELISQATEMILLARQRIQAAQDKQKA